jgi:hypothetical protein
MSQQPSWYMSLRENKWKREKQNQSRSQEAWEKNIRKLHREKGCVVV